MPPKKKQQQNQKNPKDKERVMEDKTFGLKNKKGKKQQNYINQIKLNQSGGRVVQQQQHEDKKRKEDEKKEMARLFKPVAVAEVKKENKVCTYYVKGLCIKGDKCRFSHDLSLLSEEEKAKILNPKGTPAAGADGAPPVAENATSIICKFFLGACEKNLYGPLWQCPNGRACIYQHALPPGYVLNKNKKKKGEEESSGLSIEELVEIERAKITNFTPINEETFAVWKKKYLLEKKKKQQKEGAKKGPKKKTGRELFQTQPSIIRDDENASSEVYKKKDFDASVDEAAKQAADEAEFDKINKEMADLELAAATADNGGNVEINESLFDTDEDLDGL